jgi:parallel beta-helix repeat protein
MTTAKLAGAAAVAAALAIFVSGSAAATPAAAAGDTITVTVSIQAAIDAASPGDTIRVPAGTYREYVVVTTDDLTIAGSPGAVLDGAGNPSRVGLRVRPAPGDRIDGFTLSGLRVQNWSFTGVLVSDVDNFRLTGGTYVDNGEYGLFPVHCAHGRVDHNRVSGSQDSAVYVGQCDDVLVDANVAQRNTVGIEIEASTRVDVVGNTATGNAIGGLVQLLPGLTVKVTADIRVIDNRFAGNTAANPVTDPDEPLSGIPGGVGLVNVAGDDVRISGNDITGNPTGGVGVVSLPAPLADLDPAIDPEPDHTVITGNVIAGNGRHPDPKIFALGLLPADAIWDGTGTNNCFTLGPSASTFPAALPSC